MSTFTGSDLANHLYYNKLPSVYRNYDQEYTKKKDLYRYIHAVNEGAFNDTLEQASAMVNLVNPLTCPEEWLPYLYASWGLPYFEDIGVYYNRKFLSSIGEFIRRRGTMGGIRYIIRVLTGLECDLKYERKTVDSVEGRYIYITLIAKELSKILDMDTTANIVNRFLSNHIPFYIRTLIIDSRAEMDEKMYLYSKSAQLMSQDLEYNLATMEIAPYNLSTEKAVLKLTKGYFISEGKEDRLSSIANMVKDKDAFIMENRVIKFGFITKTDDYDMSSSHHLVKNGDSTVFGIDRVRYLRIFQHTDSDLAKAYRMSHDFVLNIGLGHASSYYYDLSLSRYVNSLSSNAIFTLRNSGTIKHRLISQHIHYSLLKN